MVSGAISKSDLVRRLEKLRSLLTTHNLSAYVIPHCDAHQSEYIGPSDERLAFISGFTGSAGTAVVTASDALLWTDGRYFAQAEAQLLPGWRLMKDRVPGVPRLVDWLRDSLGSSAAVGLDPALTSAAQDKDWSAKLALTFTAENLVDVVWDAEGKSADSHGLIYVHPADFAGESAASKLARLRAEMRKHAADAAVFSALDEVAWLTNLRGGDHIPYNPVFFAYCVVVADGCVVFVDLPDTAEDVRAHLAAADITVKPYAEFTAWLATLPDSARVWLDMDATNVATLQAVRPRAVLNEPPLPVELWKASKNSSEVGGSRNAHLRDGLAKTRWLCWLEKVMATEADYTEYTVAEKLEAFRAQASEFRGLSFPSISSFGPNAAVIHYKPERDTARKASDAEMYLIDSGAQYVDGTTDVTRTMHFGKPTGEEIRAYTLVLKGVIALSTVVFPVGTTGPALDVLARVALWRGGLDYRHGTGHGVGAPLCVHEGPHYIGNAIARSEKAPAGLRTTLVPGMLVTNEPGYYKDGAFGIRIENVMVVKETDIPDLVNGAKNMLGFDTLTVIPICKKLIDKTLMTKDEVDWLDLYHRRVLETHAAKLTAEELKWLEQQCSPL